MRRPEIGSERDRRVETRDGFAVAPILRVRESERVAYADVVWRKRLRLLQVGKGLGIASLAFVPVGAQVEEDGMQRSRRQCFARQRGRARQVRRLQRRLDVLEYGRFARLGHYSESPWRVPVP